VSVQAPPPTSSVAAARNQGVLLRSHRVITFSFQ
jgi:hypothetical protein